MRARLRRRPSPANIPQGRRAAAGFTFVEMMAATAIFAIIMVAVYMMYETNQNTFQVGDALTTAQQNARIALDDITAAIRSAGSFYCSPSPSVPWPSAGSTCPASFDYVPLESSCVPPENPAAVPIATTDTLALHGGYTNPTPGGGSSQKCNAYVIYSLWNASGVRTTTLTKRTLVDPWSDPNNTTTSPQPLAENVTALTFAYFDATGQTIPTSPPAPTTPTCPSSFPWVRPQGTYALDGQGPVSGSTQPSPVAPASQRDSVRMIRVQITIDTNIAYDTTSSCYHTHASPMGGPTQSFTLTTEAYLRGPLK